MATIFSLNDLGRVFDFTLPATITPGDVLSQKIIFYKPNQLRLDKQAVLVEDTENPGEFFVQFQGEIPSFLDDKTSNWEYAAEIQLISNAIVQTSQREVFWVT